MKHSSYFYFYHISGILKKKRIANKIKPQKILRDQIIKGVQDS